MTRSKTDPPNIGRGAPLRDCVLNAAERLLRGGKAEFSMRDLAAEAGVSFATPFNQFGSKAGIMHALSSRRIEAMEQRYAKTSPPADAPNRVRLAIDKAAEVMLEEPAVNRAVMEWIGSAGPVPSQAWVRSSALWALAIGDGAGFKSARREQALRCLPGQLAFGFRGVLSFWTAGELSDQDLALCAREMAESLLLGFIGR